MIQSETGQRAERLSLLCRPTFETAIGVPLIEARLPKYTAWEQWNSPAVQALRLNQGHIENREELMERRRRLEELMKRTAAETGTDVGAVAAAVNAAMNAEEDDDEDDEVPKAPRSPKAARKTPKVKRDKGIVKMTPGRSSRAVAVE